MSVTKFVSQSNAEALMTAIGAKFSSLAGAYIYKGSIAFAALPATPTTGMGGYTYNINEDFTTDARFVEGAGKKFSAGTDVTIVDLSTYDAVTPAGSENPVTEGWYELVSGKYVLSTDTTVDAGKTYYEYNANFKFNIASSFVNVDAIETRINKVADIIAAANFNTTSPAAYSIGDLVKKDDVLYRFTAAHTAGDPWDANEVEVVTVEDLIDEVDSTLKSKILKLQAAVADTFDATTAYAAGDLVMYADELYKFTSAHTAGAWTGSDATKVSLDDTIFALVARVNNVVASIGDAFNAASAYSEGDIVVYNDTVYKFKAGGHTAGDPWDATEVDAVTVISLIQSAEPTALNTTEVNALIALLD